MLPTPPTHTSFTRCSIPSRPLALPPDQPDSSCFHSSSDAAGSARNATSTAKPLPWRRSNLSFKVKLKAMKPSWDPVLNMIAFPLAQSPPLMPATHYPWVASPFDGCVWSIYYVPEATLGLGHGGEQDGQGPCCEDSVSPVPHPPNRGAVSS